MRIFFESCGTNIRCPVTALIIWLGKYDVRSYCSRISITEGGLAEVSSCVFDLLSHERMLMKYSLNTYLTLTIGDTVLDL